MMQDKKQFPDWAWGILAAAVAVPIQFMIQALPYVHAEGVTGGRHVDAHLWYILYLGRVFPELMESNLFLSLTDPYGYHETTLSFLALGPKLLGANPYLWSLGATYVAVFVLVLGAWFMGRQLGLSRWLSFLLGLLLLQPLVLLHIDSGLLHTPAVPRDLGKALLPWLIFFWLHSRLQGKITPWVYAAAAIIYGWTYPLWLLHLSMPLLVADFWLVWRGGKKTDWILLFFSGAIAMGSFALVGILHRQAIGFASTQEFLEVTGYVTQWENLYPTKGFMRTAIFGLIGAAAFWSLSQARRLPHVLAVLFIAAGLLAMTVNLIDWAVPAFRLIFIGRVSLIFSMIALLLAVLALHVAREQKKRLPSILFGSLAFLYLFNGVYSSQTQAARSGMAIRPDFQKASEMVARHTQVTDVVSLPQEHADSRYYLAETFVFYADRIPFSCLLFPYMVQSPETTTLREDYAQSLILMDKKLPVEEREKAFNYVTGRGCRYFLTEDDLLGPFENRLEKVDQESGWTLWRLRGEG
jgi:hypothetical protein